MTATEIELLTCFEAEPGKLDADVVWFYNESTYSFTSDVLQLSFAISPAYKDVKMILKHKGTMIYELNATSVLDVTYKVESGVELLSVQLTDRHEVTIRLKPAIQIMSRVRCDVE